MSNEEKIVDELQKRLAPALQRKFEKIRLEEARDWLIIVESLLQYGCHPSAKRYLIECRQRVKDLECIANLEEGEAMSESMGEFPKVCDLCEKMIGSRIDLDWHGLGNCMPICERCNGSGIDPALPAEAEKRRAPMDDVQAGPYAGMDPPASGEIYRCKAGHTFQAVAHSRFDGAPYHCPECGNIQLELVAPASAEREAPAQELSWRDLATAIEKHKPSMAKLMSLAELTYITRELNQALATQQTKGKHD